MMRCERSEGSTAHSLISFSYSYSLPFTKYGCQITSLTAGSLCVSWGVISRGLSQYSILLIRHSRCVSARAVSNMLMDVRIATPFGAYPFHIAIDSWVDSKKQRA